MHTDTIVAIVVAGIAFVAVVAVLSHHMERKRRDACRELATRHGWAYTEDDPAYVNRWEGPPFNAGSGRKAVNVVTGEHHGHPFMMLEHRHQTVGHTGQQTTTHTHWHTIYVLTLPARVPKLELKPRGFLSGIADLFGVQDIEVGHEEFDRRMRVRSDDEQYARLFLSGPSTAQAILDLGDMQLRVVGNELLALESGRQVANRGPARLDQLTTIARSIPGTIWTTYGGA